MVGLLVINNLVDKSSCFACVFETALPRCLFTKFTELLITNDATIILRLSGRTG